MQPLTPNYHPEEILKIIQANYKQQQQVDDIALKDQELTFETTIAEWVDICDLVDTNELWKYFNYYFHLTLDREAWMEILEPACSRTLGDLCNFIALYADKEIINPIKLFANNCHTAAIFRSLTGRLKNRGIDVSGIRPSSPFEPLLKEYKGILIEEINQLAPTVLPPMEYKTNWVYKWGFSVLLIFPFVTFFLASRESGWAWTTGVISLIGYCMMTAGARMNPKQAGFEGINTMADLVRLINNKITTTPPTSQ